MKQEIIRINLEGVNCYLGKSEQGFVLFDTGGHITMDKVFTNRQDMLVKELERLGCKPGNLKAIILTHGDNDHVANAAFLREKYQTVVAIHGADVALVENLTLDKMMESFEYSSIIFKIVFLLLHKTIRRVTAKALADYTEFKPDILLKEGDNLGAYGFDAKIVHLPGHTTGSIGIITKEGELIAGDICTNMKKPSLAPNAMNFKQLKSSVEKLKTMNIKKIYPGHGDPFDAAIMF